MRVNWNGCHSVNQSCGHMQYLVIISERYVFDYHAGLVPDKEKNDTGSMFHHKDIVFKVTVFLHKHFACR